MIIQDNELELKDIGFNDSKSFGIDENQLSKIFKLLSTSVYQNIPFSICRELSSNMRDAMVEAGKLNDPILISYNSQNNLMSFKDTGVGMSPELVNTIYTKLGSTTKSDNASLIGGMGIGRMVLFAYCDIFFLDTIQNNTKYSYILSKDKKGLPQIDLINEENTEESNGTTVSFELKNGDLKVFSNAIKHQLKYFTNVITEGFDLNNDYKIIKGEHFILRNDTTNYSGFLEICWGEVFYDIPWNQMNLVKMNVNCALYFPIETPFRPTAAREALEVTEKSTELIKEKIKLASEELTEIWKSQQIVDSFFEWNNKGSKTVDLNGHSLNISALVNEEFVFSPTLNTNIDPKKFKSNIRGIFTSLFTYRENSRHYGNGWSKIGVDKCIYHSTNKAEISSSKLAKANWKAVVREKDFIYHDNLIEYLYTKDVLSSEYKNGVTTIHNPKNIDYVKEINEVAAAIWKEITEKSEDLRLMSFASERNRFSIENSQVRGKFSTVYGNKWEIRDLSWINQFKYVVVTTDETEYDKLCQIELEGWSKKKGKKFRIDNYYLAILTNKKYLKKLNHCLTYDQFLRSKVMGAYYYKWYTSSLSGYFNKINAWENIHPMYKSKFKELKHSLKDRYRGHIDHRIKTELAAIYSTDHIDDQYYKAKEMYDKLEHPGSLYELLYRYTKKQLTKLKCTK